MGGTATSFRSLAIRTSAPKMSTKKVIVMILHAVQNRIHVSVPVAVHVERACSEYTHGSCTIHKTRVADGQSGLPGRPARPDI